MMRRLDRLSMLNQDEFIALGYPNGLLLMDVDNTLLSPYEKQISEDQKNWIESMSKTHRILLNTNNFTRRQSSVGVELRIPILMMSFKPFPWRIKKFLKQQNVDMNEVIIIGDQVITDVLLALWLKRPYFLIKPLANDKHIITRFFRILESMVIQSE